MRIDQLAVAERVPVTGTPFNLYYSSDRVLGRTNSYSLQIPVTNSSPDSDIASVSVTVTVAGRTFTQNYPTISANLTYNFTWDGKDSGGNYLDASQTATVTINTTYYSAATDYPVVTTFQLGNLRAQSLGLGGWLLDAVHFYDSSAQLIYYGDGTSGDASAAQAVTGGGFLLPSKDGSEVYYFDSTGRHMSTKTPLLGATKYTMAYDGNGRLTSITDNFSNATSITRDMSGNFTGIQSPYSQTTSVTLDTNGYLATITNPNSETYTMTYGSGGLLDTFQKPRGQTSTMTYTTDGLLTGDTSSAGNSSTLAQTISSGVNSITLTSAVGRQTSYTTQNTPTSTVRSTTYADGNNASYSCSLGSVSYSDNYVTDYVGTTADPRLGAGAQYLSYDSKSLAGLGSSFNFYASKSVTFTGGVNNLYNIDQLTETDTANSQTYTSVFDGTALTNTVTTPESREYVWTVDSNERPSAFQLATLNPIGFSYDTHGRLHQITQSTRTTTLAYDTSGRLSSVTNPASQVTGYAYDSANRVNQITLPDSRVIAIAHDSNGNITGVTPPGSSQHVFVENNFDLDYKYEPPTLSSTTNTTYTYNNDKQPSVITRPNGDTITYAYVSGSPNLSTITTTAGTYTYTYSGPHISEVISPDQMQDDLTYHGSRLASDYLSDASTSTSLGSVTANRNAFFNLSYLAVADAGTGSGSVSYSYDNDQLMTAAGSESLTPDSDTGQLSATSLGSISSAVGYSANGEMTSDTYTYSGTTLYSIALTRDALGRVSQKVETIGGVSTTYGYTFDSAGRLTTVTTGGTTTATYSFDSNSNRTGGTIAGVTQSGTVDAQDRLTAYNTRSYTYNLNGEPTSIYDSSTSTTTSFTYDTYGDLKSVTLPSSTVISYLTDGFNRRVAKFSGGTLQARYLYFGSRLVGELDSSGTLAKYYVYGSKTNVPDYMVTSTSTYRIISDQVGSVRLVVDSSVGTIAQEIDYDVFGRISSDTSPGFQAFGFAGGMYDPDTKLVHFGAREYDSYTGRWLTKDPILFGGGDVNLYGYVWNDPINWSDRRGLTGDKYEGDGGTGFGGGNGGFGGWGNGAGGGGGSGSGGAEGGGGGAGAAAEGGGGGGGAASEMCEARAENPITGYTRHGINSAISRTDGGSMSPQAILNTVTSPSSVGPNPGGGTIYMGPYGQVILNPGGKVITVIPSGSGSFRVP